MYELGRVHYARGTLEALQKEAIHPAWLLGRHAHGDRGEIAPEALGLEEEHLAMRETSIFALADGAIWVTTTMFADTPVTTVILVPQSVLLCELEDP